MLTYVRRDVALRHLSHQGTDVGHRLVLLLLHLLLLPGAVVSHGGGEDRCGVEPEGGSHVHLHTGYSARRVVVLPGGQALCEPWLVQWVAGGSQGGSQAWGDLLEGTWSWGDLPGGT